jgi:hypothetical protein
VSDGIRTRDVRNHNPTPCEQKRGDGEDLRQSASGACRKSPVFEPDLQVLIDAWPTLPEALRCGILAMVKAAKGN